jgi:hypothetical protein
LDGIKFKAIHFETSHKSLSYSKKASLKKVLVAEARQSGPVAEFCHASFRNLLFLS